MKLFFFGSNNDPKLKDGQDDRLPENIGDPNFDESFNQGSETMDDSLRMVDQPLAGN